MGGPDHGRGMSSVETPLSRPALPVTALAKTPPSSGVAELHREHYASLVRMAALMVDSRSRAEEIVQDAFTELIARWSQVQPDAALGYLRKSVANRARSALRRRRTARNHRPSPPGLAAAADERVLRAAGFEVLLRAVGDLPIRQRQVIVLRYYSGASISQTAAALGISAAAVTTSTHRALRSLAPFKDDLR